MSDEGNNNVHFVSAEAARDLGEESLIGLSLSMCVLDIASGRVQEERVKKIIAGTKLGSERGTENVLQQYQNDYWRDFSNASAIAQRLFEQGKVEQPRCAGGPAPNVCRAHWQEAATGTPINFDPPSIDSVVQSFTARAPSHN